LPTFFERFPNWSRRVLARADALVSPSEFLARAASSLGFPALVIPNVLDLGRYPYRARRQASPRLLWMRSFYPYYNPFLAIRVLTTLKKKVPNATLVMAGQDKGIEGDVRDLARQMGVEGAVQFVGFLDHAGKIREGHAADIFLNTNNVDNMPVSVLEACALGLPVVATNVGGIPDLLKNNDTALLVDDDDHEAMADAVYRIIKEPDLCARLSSQGRRLAESCAWQQVYPRWQSLISEVMRRRRPDTDSMIGNVVRQIEQTETLSSRGERILERG
jgi:glycosyltransferase involved in cell wall biosynthesis